MLKNQEKRIRRHRRIRSRVVGTKERPRLCIFRSNQHIYAQLIDDERGKTLLAVSDVELKKSAKTKKLAIAAEIGKLIAQKAIENKIEKVVFDRGGYKYHGTIKVLADAVREGGLKF